MVQHIGGLEHIFAIVEVRPGVARVIQVDAAAPDDLATHFVEAFFLNPVRRQKPLSVAVKAGSVGEGGDEGLPTAIAKIELYIKYQDVRLLLLQDGVDGFQQVWLPEVVCVQKEQIAALGSGDACLASHQKPLVFLVNETKTTVQAGIF